MRYPLSHRSCSLPVNVIMESSVNRALCPDRKTMGSSPGYTRLSLWESAPHKNLVFITPEQASGLGCSPMELPSSFVELRKSYSQWNEGLVELSVLPLSFIFLWQLSVCNPTIIIRSYLIVEKYFDMNRKQCKEALDIYKKFLVRMEKTAEFLKVAEVFELCIWPAFWSF